jgi:hypothetical protein
MTVKIGSNKWNYTSATETAISYLSECSPNFLERWLRVFLSMTVTILQTGVKLTKPRQNKDLVVRQSPTRNRMDPMEPYQTPETEVD